MPFAALRRLFSRPSTTEMSTPYAPTTPIDNLPSSTTNRPHSQSYSHRPQQEPPAPLYLTPQELLHTLRTNPSSVAVVDVREDDRAGGHIAHSHHVPAPALRRNPSRFLHLADGVDRVVFHCMFSQCRGPSCASAFSRALWREAYENGHGGGGSEGSIDRLDGGYSGESLAPLNSDAQQEVPAHMPQVCVLAGGFQAFAALAMDGNMDVVDDLDTALYSR